MRKISQIRPVGAEYGRAGGGLELGRRYFDKRGDRPVYVRTAAPGETITWDVSDYTKVRIFYYEFGGVYHAPIYSLDGGTDVSCTGTAWDAGNYLYATAEIDVSANTILRIDKSASGNSLVGGIMATMGRASDISVMNLSRTSSKATDWASWIDPAAAQMAIFQCLMQGFDPDLVVMLSGGNDFWDGVGSESTWHARLNSLRSDILVFSPNADLAVYTNPPMNPGAGDYAAWTAFNQWTRNWAQANDMILIDWEAYLPPAGTSDAWYQNDTIHPRASLSGRMVDCAAQVLFPSQHA